MLKEWLLPLNKINENSISFLSKDELSKNLINAIQMIQVVLKSNIDLREDAMNSEEKIEYLYS